VRFAASVGYTGMLAVALHNESVAMTTTRGRK
jgi:hypothetical protein